MEFYGTGISIAQAASDTTITSFNSFIDSASQNLGESLPRLLGGLIILVVGWLLAVGIAFLVRRVLKAIQLNRRVGRWITGTERSDALPPVEQWLAIGTCTILMVFVVAACFEAIGLDAVSVPLNRLLQQVLGFLPNLIGAALLMGLAWLLATMGRFITVRSLNRLRVDERLNNRLDDDVLPSNQPIPLNQTMGNALYWFVILLFVSPVLTTLGLQNTIQPVQALVNEFLLVLPNVAAAILVALIGWFIARIVRGITTNFLASAGADQLGKKVGLTASKTSLSAVIGNVVYVLILIPVGITTLNKLQIEAISRPAIAMLSRISVAIPQVLSAIALLVLAYVIGKRVAATVTEILANAGFNNLLAWVGVTTPPATTDNESNAALPLSLIKTPAELVGIIVFIGIMLVAATTAVDLLELTAVAGILQDLLATLGRIIAGVVIFAIGLYAANQVFKLITSTEHKQAQVLGQIARVAIITLVSAMGLQQMGIATSIVNLTFGLLVGSIAVAIAIAFGLGGREIAAEHVRTWLAHLKGTRHS